MQEYHYSDSIVVGRSDPKSASQRAPDMDMSHAGERRVRSESVCEQRPMELMLRRLRSRFAAYPGYSCPDQCARMVSVLLFLRGSQHPSIAQLASRVTDIGEWPDSGSTSTALALSSTTSVQLATGSLSFNIDAVTVLACPLESVDGHESETGSAVIPSFKDQYSVLS